MVPNTTTPVLTGERNGGRSTVQGPMGASGLVPSIQINVGSWYRSFYFYFIFSGLCALCSADGPLYEIISAQMCTVTNLHCVDGWVSVKLPSRILAIGGQNEKVELISQANRRVWARLLPGMQVTR